MSYKDIEERLAQLEKHLSEVEGTKYSKTMLTLPFYTPLPPLALARQWLSECSVETEDLMVARHRNIDVKLPVLHIGEKTAPNAEWLILGHEVRTSKLSDYVDERNKEWIHPLLISRYRQWATTQN